MNHQGTVRLVIVVLGVALLAALSGIVWLAYNRLPVPEALAGVATTALGAIGAMLASTRTERVE